MFGGGKKAADLKQRWGLILDLLFSRFQERETQNKKHSDFSREECESGGPATYPARSVKLL